MYNTLHSISDKEWIGLIGEKLKEFRLQANLSQTNLAEKTGMSRSSIAEIEKGRNFSIASFIAILRALDCLDKIEHFSKPAEIVLSPIEVYERQKKQRKRGGYKK